MVFTAENRAVVRDLPPLLGDRFIDVGITEQNMIAMAAGMALRGRKPICHALTNFYYSELMSLFAMMLEYQICL